jgi:hypothetical protein
MQLIIKNMSYSHLMWMQTRGEAYQRAISMTSFSEPQVDSEGMTGYICVREVTFMLKDITAFAKLHNEWYNLADEHKSNFEKYIRTGINK